VRRALAVVVFAAIPALIPAPVAARDTAGVAAPAPGLLLVARRDLSSPRFAESVILLLRHGEAGTLGVIVNRRTRFQLHDLLPDLVDGAAQHYPMFIGGPVAPQLILMLIRNAPTAGERVTGDIRFSAERPLLEALVSAGKPASELRFYAGHAGWARGQLEQELARGDWYLLPAETALVFSEDETELWERLIDRLDPPGIRVRAPARHARPV
jgi:putative transcriptional regulator